MKIVSQETRDRCRAAKLGKKRKPFTAEHLRRMSEVQVQRRVREAAARQLAWESAG